MPLYDYHCSDCGKSSEILLTRTDERPECPQCGSRNLNKLLSAHSSLSGTASGGVPGPGDTACCGSHPNHDSCAGPGTCCGKHIQ
jgi:putative FmdB family regulatory protein